jgi:hypothetical protein
VNIGLWRIGADCAIMSINPEKIPPALTPAIARLMINPTELGVMPQSNEPSSNKLRAARYTHFIGKNVYSFL